MNYIYLSNGGRALIDREDYNYLNQFTWHKDRYGYAKRTWSKEGKCKNTTLHRELLKPPSNLQVDHINGDRLDNRRENLRLCTSQENNRNSKGRGGRSGYKGVQWCGKGKDWVVFIHIDKKRKYLGKFNDKKKGAMAYNKAAKKYFGEFARLNKL